MECKRPSEFATDATSITCKSQALLFTATRLVWLHLLHVSHKHICFQLYQLVWLFTNILLYWTDHPPQEPLWREDSPRLPCVQWHWPRQLGILWHGLLKTQQRRVFNQTIHRLWHGLLKKEGFQGETIHWHTQCDTEVILIHWRWCSAVCTVTPNFILSE